MEDYEYDDEYLAYVDEMEALADSLACGICDGRGHGYPGGRPCPLEDRSWVWGRDDN